MNKKKTEISILLDVQDLQLLLKIGRDSAYSLMRSKSFPSIRIGGRYRVSRKALEEWLEINAYKKVLL